jgi:phosphoglycerol transferase MdoB-like AlkP superfamily enzyme
MLFTHFHSNASRSIEAQPAVLNSLPDVYMRPIIGSHYEKLRHRGLAHILAEKGYSTGYFMGCNRGVLGIDHYAEVSGFQHYYGMEEYPDKEKDYDQYWGIFDEPFMCWMAQKQDEMPRPFFTTFFSCTNHHPFPLPATGAEDIKAMDLNAQERTVVYTDRAVKSYLRKVRQYAWADSTIFILTGDHCFYLESDPHRAMPDQFHVPLILNGPGITPAVDARPGSQVCIMPTLIDYLHLDTWHASTGTSLLRSAPEPFALNNLMGIVSFTQNSTSISRSLERDFSVSVLDGSVWKKLKQIEDLPPSQRKEMEDQLISLYQVIQHCRVEDRFVPPQNP